MVVCPGLTCANVYFLLLLPFEYAKHRQQIIIQAKMKVLLSFVFALISLVGINAFVTSPTAHPMLGGQHIPATISVSISKFLRACNAFAFVSSSSVKHIFPALQLTIPIHHFLCP